MAAGIRSHLAPWLGGAAAPAAAVAAVPGRRSLAAPWLGGAAAPAAVVPSAGGRRSLFAPWLGGAAAGAVQNPAGAGSVRVPRLLREAISAGRMRDDDLLLSLIAAHFGRHV